MMSRNRTATRAVLLAAAACAALLTGCTTTGTTAAPATPTAAVSPAPVVSIRDQWVKTADKGMSAAFGTLVNTGDKDLTVVSATSTASPMMELHEIATVNGKMVMRPKTGGFVIPARGTHELAPGGDHLMMMDVTTAVKAGDAVTVTLTLSDGSKVEFTAVGKVFAGGNESYAPMTMG